MTLQDVIEQLNLKVLTGAGDLAASTPLAVITPTSGYASDLLSCVMAGAKHGAIWVTLQAHINIVAVAALLEMSAVIITEGAQPDQATLDKALQENVTLLSTDQFTYEVVGRLWELGLR